MSRSESTAMRVDEFPHDLFSLDIDSLEIGSSKDSEKSLKLKTEPSSPYSLSRQSPQLEMTPSLSVELEHLNEQSDMLLDTGLEASDLNSDLSLGSILNSVTTAGLTATSEVPSTLSLSDIQLFSAVAAVNSTFSQPFPSESAPATPGYITPAISPNSSYPSSPRGGIILTKSAHSSGTTTPTGAGTKVRIPRHKRQSHIRAEHKRRNKIQNGFDEIQALVPALQELNNSGKESKSNMLNKTVEYCRQLKAENKALQKESDQLRAEIHAMTADIKAFQEEMPDSGLSSSTPPSPVPAEKQFEDYLHAKTVSNWKFWIFGLLIRPLFQSFNQSVSTNSTEEFYSTVLNWVDEHLSLRCLRPAVFNTLRHVSTRTSVIAEPSRLPEEALKAALSGETMDQSPPPFGTLL